MISRIPWQEGFPDVVVHGELKDRNQHPDFKIAKAGNARAALSLVRDLLSEAALDRLRSMSFGRQPLVVPVSAIEASGFNAIPDAMAQEISNRLGLEAFSSQILQSNKVAHTRADGWHRLATPPTFVGEIVVASNYLLVDDHVGFGGTFANLRGHIEQRGGHVIGMTALTETGGGRQIAIRPATLSMLRSKHGLDLQAFWCRYFGHGLDCLTGVDGGYLCRVEPLDAIRARLAEAAERARRRGVSAVAI